MMDSGTTLSAELGLLLVVPQHAAVAVVASLFYSGDDPYAVRMAFHVGTDEPVEWIFARDLLAAGMTEPAGEGDVRAWPSSGDPDGEGDGETLLNIVLSSPFGQAPFQAPMAPMAPLLHPPHAPTPPPPPQALPP